MQNVRVTAGFFRYLSEVPETRHIRNLALIGFMGTGKSTVGQATAAHLGFQFFDTDKWIEEKAGLSIAQIFTEKGEAAFRVLEQETVRELEKREKIVIATGGGLGADPGNLASLKSHALVVCLWASVDSIWQRVKHQSHRPLLQGEDPRAKITQLLNERAFIYRTADLLVNTDHRSPRQVAYQILHEFKAAAALP